MYNMPNSNAICRAERVVHAVFDQIHARGACTTCSLGMYLFENGMLYMRFSTNYMPKSIDYARETREFGEFGLRHPLSPVPVKR